MGRDVTAGGKTDPVARSVSVDKVAGIGLQQVRTVQKELYAGRGFNAPGAKAREYNKGSQGKY